MEVTLAHGSVGLKTLRNKLSEYVRLAVGGEMVSGHRDRVVAEIGPPNPTRSSLMSDALLSDVFRQGWMTPPISVGRGPPPRQPVMTLAEMSSGSRQSANQRLSGQRRAP
jgi:antitoxin (DNA-binding transcriptional repressor) of toxin-antitoxin stability system